MAKMDDIKVTGTIAPPEESRVESFSVERLFNLGNYENIKYHIRVAVGKDDHPGLLLASVERILNDLRADGGVSNYDVAAARRVLAKPESELDDYDKRNLDAYRGTIEKHEAAKERRREARKALATLDYTVEHKDHKEDWEDDYVGDDGFDVEF